MDAHSPSEVDLMSAGKFLSLEEVRKNPKLLKRFIKQHESAGDLDAFAAALSSMAKTPPKANLIKLSKPILVKGLPLGGWN